MFRNYIKIAIRNINKQKVFSLINIFGLSIGIACAMLILLWIRYEMNYDDFHKDLDKICRVVSEYNGYRVPTTPGPLAQFIEETVPEVEVATRFKNSSSTVTYGEKSLRLQGINIEPEFLDVFTFQVISGDARNSIGDVSTFILTETIAKNLFGDEDPIGKVVKLDNRWDATITAIVKDVPKNSSPPLRFEYLAPFQTYYFWRNPDSWTANSDYQTWLKLKDRKYLASAMEKINQAIRVHESEANINYIFQPLGQIHLRPNTDRWDGPHGDIKYVYIFSLLAIIVLVIACINFTNLAIARSLTRTKEIGIRKVVGARRKQLLSQFFTETLIINVISLLVAIILTKLALPWFSSVTRQTYSLNLLDNENIMIAIILFILIAVASGIYPALYLSGLPLTKILQNKLLTNRKKSLFSFRKILLFSQFTLAIIVISATIIIHQQMQFIQNKKLGFDKENLIYVSVPSNYATETYRSFKNDLKANPNILAVGGSNQIPTTTDFVTTVSFTNKGIQRHESFPIFRVDEDFLDTYHIKLVQGRNFSNEILSDLDHSFIVNETALKLLNLDNPFETELNIWQKQGRIIGVVKDFHFENLKEQIKPMAFLMTDQCNWLNIRLTPGQLHEKIGEIKSTLLKYYPHAPFRLRFMEKEIDNLYEKENRMYKVFKYFAFLSIFITALGLYGIISFVTVDKTKEVGIRKVLGASELSIIGTVSKEFLQLVLLANLIAWPVVYLFMGEWLISFAYRINLTPIPFFIGGLLSITIAVLTIFGHIYLVARSNPVEALKYE